MAKVDFIKDDGTLWYSVDGDWYGFTRQGTLVDLEGFAVTDELERKEVTMGIWLATRALCRLEDGIFVRPATEAECAESDAAAELDGGAGAIKVDGVTCYVEE